MYIHSIYFSKINMSQDPKDGTKMTAMFKFTVLSRNFHGKGPGSKLEGLLSQNLRDCFTVWSYSKDRV